MLNMNMPAAYSRKNGKKQEGRAIFVGERYHTVLEGGETAAVIRQ